LIVLLMIVAGCAAAAVPYPRIVMFAVPAHVAVAVAVQVAGGVYVAVTVQDPLGTYGDAGVPAAAFAGTAASPGLIAVPTAHVPPITQVPVPVSGVSMMKLGTNGPASTLGAG
jgi:hypothetical protein